MADDRKKRAAKLAEEGIKKYGHLSAMTGKNNIKTSYYSSGSPTLDYMLGTGGFPDNGIVEVFGPPSIGKTTIYGYGVMRSVQEAGGLTAIIATEPNVDEEWMEKHGVKVYQSDVAATAIPGVADSLNAKTSATSVFAGATQDEAIVSLALANGWKLWNEL